MKTELKLNYSCEIGNLIDVFAEYMGKTFNEVEEMAFDEGLYPTTDSVYTTTQFGLDEHRLKQPLRVALFNYMTEAGIRDLYINR
jgi:hypothetical protein